MYAKSSPEDLKIFVSITLASCSQPEVVKNSYTQQVDETTLSELIGDDPFFGVRGVNDALTYVHEPPVSPHSELPSTHRQVVETELNHFLHHRPK